MGQVIYRELIVYNLEAENCEDAIRKAGARLYDAGFVKDTYIAAAVERETEYPTGLQLENVAIAMPHTDATHINRPAVCIARLKKSVAFAHMGDPDTKVEAELMLMMAIQNPDEQIDTLQKVLGVFQQPDVAAAFCNADSEDALFAAAREYIG